MKGSLPREDCPAASRNWTHAGPWLNAPEAQPRRPVERRLDLLVVQAHPARRRAPARARLGSPALRPLLRRAPGGAPPGGELAARGRERATARGRTETRLSFAADADIESWRDASGDRDRPHLRTARGRVRLRRRPRRPARLDGPLSEGLPAREAQPI